MSLSLSDSAGLLTGWKRLKVDFAVCTSSWICTADQRKNKEITRLNYGFIREGEGHVVSYVQDPLVLH